MKTSRSEYLTIRGLRYHIRHWGKKDDPLLFMLHGWMDNSVTFQFLIDCFQKQWHIIAPDWRGFGLTEWTRDGYWYPDYLGDLDAILNYYSAETPVRLLGHSLGGNVACMYAGIRSARIKQLISLEGYGAMRLNADDAPDRYTKWLDALDERHPVKAYACLEDVIRRVKKNNPRLDEEKAIFLATYGVRENGNNEWEILADPLHRRINPVQTRMDEALACWKLISAPTLMINGEYSLLGMRMGDYEQAREEIKRRASVIRNVQILTVKDAAHMVQQDQPEMVAKLVEDFLV